MQPYRHFAYIYDQVMDTVPYDEWVSFASKLLGLGEGSAGRTAGGEAAGGTPDEDAPGGAGPRHVLDACCGTGNVALRLARSGCRVTGVDLSEEMLDVAAQKARDLLDQGALATGAFSWSRQDVRALRLPQPADAAVCLYDSLNYLLTPEDLQAALSAIAGALRPGGLFVFDVFQRWDADREIPVTQIIQGPGWSVVWENHFDRASRQWQINLRGVTRQDGQRRRFSERHTERAYTQAQVKEALTAAGLQLIRAYDGFHDKPATRFTERVVYLAERP